MKPDFDFIWKLYPNTKGRKEALRHFNSSIKTEQDMAEILAALENYKSEIRQNNIAPQFICNGKTWFHNWKDYRLEEPPEEPADAIVGHSHHCKWCETSHDWACEDVGCPGTSELCCRTFYVQFLKRRYRRS